MLLNELQTVSFCKSFMKWSCISSNGGKSSLFDTKFPPVFNCFSGFQNLLGSVICKVSSFLINFWSYLHFSFLHKLSYTFLNPHMHNVRNIQTTHKHYVFGDHFYSKKPESSGSTYSSILMLENIYHHFT